MRQASTHQFWTNVHRYLGLATLLFLFLAAFTGCFLCVDKTIDAALNPDLFHTGTAGPVLTPLEAIAKLERARPDLVVTRFPIAVHPDSTIEAVVSPRDRSRPLGYDQIFVDPHGARIVGTRQSGRGWGRRHIVEGVYEFHYTLLAGRWGRWLMGIAALGWLIGNGVGAYLTLPPRGPFWRKWRRSWAIDWRARLRWMMLDLHRAGGLWLLAGMMVMAFTSASMNFFDEAFTPIVSAISPPRSSPFDRPGAAARSSADIGFAGALADAVAIAREKHLTWSPAFASRLPDRGLYGIAFTPTGYETYRWLGPVTYYVTADYGRFVYADDPYNDSRGRGFSRAIYPFHSGQVIGPLGVGIVFLLGLATMETCVSGLYLWWKKRRSRRAMEKTRRQARARS